MTTCTETSIQFTTDQIIPDKIASSTLRCDLDAPITIAPYVIAGKGYCVAVRALEEKTRYNQLECTDGVFRTIHKGDVLVGTLGEREALKGYSGHVPRHIEPGDTLNVLNLGGIIGQCTSAVPNLGPALKVEVLGAVLTAQEGQWTHASIQDNALKPVTTLTGAPPLVVVSGTAMDTGKTLAACQIIEGLTKQGLRVGAAKLTGAALMRDVRRMQDHGAVACATFTDAGVASSTHASMGPLAKGIIAHLSAEAPDVIVIEMGDGFIGYYGVDELLQDKELQHFTSAHVVTATDLAGVWAAERLFHERYRAPITAITGPVTDNSVGKRFIQQRIGIPAHNAMQDADALTECVSEALRAEPASMASALSSVSAGV